MAIVIVVGGVGVAMRYNPFAKLETIPAMELARVMRSHLPKR
jgi:energy-converting hydrogenase Eha subunit C